MFSVARFSKEQPKMFSLWIQKSNNKLFYNSLRFEWVRRRRRRWDRVGGESSGICAMILLSKKVEQQFQDQYSELKKANKSSRNRP